MPWIEAKYAGKCVECRAEIEAEERVYFNGKLYCEDCGADVAPDEEDDEEEVEPAGVAEEPWDAALADLDNWDN